MLEPKTHSVIETDFIRLNLQNQQELFYYKENTPDYSNGVTFLRILPQILA